MSPEETRHAAQRAMGNVVSTKEQVRGMWQWARLEVLIQDLRYALRGLRNSPGFAATAVLTLALGIGGQHAVFTLMDSVVLKPLTYRDSKSLVAAWERIDFSGGDHSGPNPRHWDMWRQRASAFQDLPLLQHWSIGVALGRDHSVIEAAVAALPNLFDVLQVRPMLGRTFTPEDAVKGRDQVAVLTYDLWQSMFHGDPNVIGKTVRMSNVQRQVIGVLPAGFHFPNANALPAFTSEAAGERSFGTCDFSPCRYRLQWLQLGW